MQQPAAEESLGLFKKYEFKRWTADVEAGKWLQAKGAKPAAKPQETSVADEAPEVTATVISYDNYVTILDEETLKAWIAKLEKRRYLHLIPKPTALITSLLTWSGFLLLSSQA